MRFTQGYIFMSMTNKKHIVRSTQQPQKQQQQQEQLQQQGQPSVGSQKQFFGSQKPQRGPTASHADTDTNR